MRRLCLIIFISAGLASGMFAQTFHMPKPSPTITVNQEFSTSFIKLTYSRPAARGRFIFGHLIPFGQVWRTGANQATQITFGEEVYVAGQALPAGTYALYTIPGLEQWKIIFNKEVHNWGAVGYDKSKNVVAVTVPVQHHKKTQESLRISLEDLTNNSALLNIAWANVSVEVPIAADNNVRILTYLDKALKGGKPPYSQAINYYLTTDQRLDDALLYSKLAIRKNPEAWYLYWMKAQVLQKLGQHKKAVAAAKKAYEITKKDQPAFVHEFKEHYLHMKAQK